jgi:pimeloyl-ACP methyl ester carboxylesterase
VRIAYQVVGDGPVDLTFSPSHVTNLAATWDDSTYAAFLRRLASMGRLILFDKRGTGLSDPALDFPSPRERSEDLANVLDAVGSPGAVLFGVCGGGALCAHLAADHPERAAGLILFNSAARTLRSDDYPWGCRWSSTGGSSPRSKRSGWTRTARPTRSACRAPTPTFSPRR